MHKQLQKNSVRGEYECHIKIENLTDMIIEIRDESVLLDADVAQIYGVETRDINKTVENNPDKFPAGYIVELSKSEKDELVENLHQFDKLKHSTVNPKAVAFIVF